MFIKFYLHKLANAFEMKNVFCIIHPSVATLEAMIIKMPCHHNY